MRREEENESERSDEIAQNPVQLIYQNTYLLLWCSLCRWGIPS